jgi:hypothetical protein
MRPSTRPPVLLTRAALMLAAAALCLATWAAPTRAQSCYGDSYGGGACYSGSYSYGYATGPAYSTTGSVYYAAPTVGSRLAYRATHPLAGLRGRFAARRALRGSYGVGGACYSEGYGGGCYGGTYGYSGGACYSATYAAPAHYHAAPMTYATPAYQPATWAAPNVAPANCPNGFCPQVRSNGGTVPAPAPAPMPAPMPMPSPAPSPQSGAGTGNHPCPCGDAACNHTLGSCPCTDPACKCHLPGPNVAPSPAPVAPHHPGKAVKP